MKMYRKITSLGLAAVLTMTLAACGSTKSDSQQPAASNSPKSTANAAAEKIKISMWSQFSDPNSKDGGFIGFYKALDATKAKFPNVEIEHTGIGEKPIKRRSKRLQQQMNCPIFSSHGAEVSRSHSLQEIAFYPCRTL